MTDPSKRYAAVAPPRPATLRAAIGLLYATAGLAVVWNALNLVAGLRAEDSENPASQVTAAIVFSLGYGLLCLWAATITRLNRAGARFVTTVLAAGTMGLLLLRLQDEDRLPAHLVSDLVGLALGAVLLALLWSPDTSTYLREVAAASRRGDTLG